MNQRSAVKSHKNSQIFNWTEHSHAFSRTQWLHSRVISNSEIAFFSKELNATHVHATYFITFTWALIYVLFLQRWWTWRYKTLNCKYVFSFTIIFSRDGSKQPSQVRYWNFEYLLIPISIPLFDLEAERRESWVGFPGEPHAWDLLGAAC